MQDNRPSVSPIQTVLAPVAASPRLEAVANEAARLARVLGAELVLVHVGPATTAKSDAVRERLAQAAIGEYEFVIRHGKPAKEIVALAEQRQANLIVLGALEKEGFLGYYLGSVARKVAREAPCSVLLLTEPKTAPISPRRWVVTVRYDQPSLELLCFVASLAKREHPERIDIVREYTLGGFGLALETDLDSRDADAWRKRLQQEEQQRLLELLACADLTGQNVRPVCVCGREGFEAAQYARSAGADLLLTTVPPRRLRLFDALFQHGVEFALESLPCGLLLFRGRSSVRISVDPGAPPHEDAR